MEASNSNQLVPGQRFCPMDDELVLFYLKPMLNGENVPGRNRVVFDCDLYGKKEPWEIWEEFKTKRPHDLRLNKDIYFFTQHKTMSSTDKRIRRNVGRGTWKGDDSGKPVVSVETGRVVGLKKRLTYKNEVSVQDGCWILYEFFLDRSLRDKKQKKHYVLCLLRKNGEPKTKNAKKRKQREQDEFLEKNCGSDDTGISSGEQEELLQPQAKKQRTGSAPLTIPSQDEDDDASEFAAELEETLGECIEDEYEPSLGAEAICIGGEENVGQQPLAADDFLDALLEGFMSSDIDVGEQNVVNNSSTLVDASTSSSISAAYDCCTDMPYMCLENGCIDPSAGTNSDVCGGVMMGYKDGVCMSQSSVEIPTDDEQQKTADADFSEVLGLIDFSPEANNSVCNEMQLCPY